MLGGAMLLVAAFVLLYAAYALAIAGGTEPVPLILTVVAVVAGVAGVSRMVRLLAIPDTATFDGQVIARWREWESNENGGGHEVPFIAVDDARRAWTFQGSYAYDRVVLSDLVRVRASPRSGHLYDLTVTGRASRRLPEGL
jgi:hypothetical protein